MLLTGVIGRFILRRRTHLPSFFIKRIVSDLPGLKIKLIMRRILVGVHDVRVFPLHDTPDKRICAINGMTRVTFFKRMALPSKDRRLLKGLSIRPTRAIRLLEDITDRCERARAFALITQVIASRIRRIIPTSARS